MRTQDYKWYQPSFPEYNVAQASVVPFLDQDVNLVISFSTAAGKTVLAEGAMAYHLATQDGFVAYVCPFKSLASEKMTDWTGEQQLSRYGLNLWSGDSDGDFSRNNRIIVSTMESFDFKTRSESWEPVLKDIRCVVFDEAHMIGDKARGGSLEASIIRFTRMSPSARVILLSATMSNSMAIAKWVKSLNGKPTKCITSQWRPTRVIPVYHSFSVYNEKVDQAVDLAIKSAGQKTLVFVHSKVTGAEIVKRIRKAGHRAVFHNASLSAHKRRKIEEVFGNPTSGLNILVSTSTLGSGVNL